MSPPLSPTTSSVESSLFLFAAGFAFGIGATFVMLALGGPAVLEGHAAAAAVIGVDASTASMAAGGVLFAMGGLMLSMSSQVPAGASGAR